jgi:uncharacterized membrane protein YgcG
VVLLAGLALVGLVATGAGAQERSLLLEAFHATVEVEPDGDVEVTERLRPRFMGSWNGLLRDLSLQHRTATGRRARLNVELVGATDGDGRELEVETERPSSDVRRFRIWVPDAEDVTRTVVLRYRVFNAVRHFYDEGAPGGARDELYWNVTGNDWRVPIRRASATFLLPPGAEPTDVQPYTGFRGDTRQDASVETAGSQIEVEADDEIRPGQGLTVSVSWPPGFVPRPGPAGRALEQVRRWWPLGLPVVALVGMVGLWARTGRDPRGRAVAVAYDPPDELSPAEAGTLVDHRAEMHDLTSTVVDLAVRGYLRIEEDTDSRFFGLSSSTEYVFHLLRRPGEWGDLRPHESRLLRGMFRRELPELGGVAMNPDSAAQIGAVLDTLGRFLPASKQGVLERVERRLEEATGSGLEAAGGGTGGAREEASRGGAEGDDPAAALPVASVELSDLKNRFSSTVARMRDDVYDRLEAQGHYDRRPDEVKQRWWGMAVTLLVVGAIAAAVSASLVVYLGHPGAVVGGFGGSALLVGLVGTFMPARTVKGARAREAVLGFKEFLERVEQPRYKAMITSPRDFERYLPYAMAFRVEDRWSEAFEGLVTEPPTWYVGSRPGDTFRPTRFTSDLRSMSSETSSTFTSTASSGGSSGFGGGGSSGGGSGGGGGGGF